ncbi:LOW QUALITY PROTEIN: FAST kinase domain-containing protein 4 [Rhinatrema bivittatum]|uniref:LOW QUALITY PROTEIN: FAST kinase domain-containing protein 4 n=1 Tax=Rhinatrema bivittatum TaxID=194408 RepID=UPI00112742E6|nr:LOW QUALITY PROTEIN: FAST kinase domain-containing protein 4 [Rhinatrema bivittatum]
MASRLVQRCSRIFGISVLAPLTESSCAVAIASKKRLGRSLPLAALAQVHNSSLSWSTEQPLVKEQVYNKHTERSEVDSLIESSSNIEELLQLSTSSPLNGNQAALIIIQLSRLAGEQKLDVGRVLQDGRFQQLLQITGGQVSVVWNGNLVSLLRSLLSLGLNDASKELKSVEQEVRWRLRRMNFKHLVLLADFYVPFACTQIQKDLVSDLVRHLELRWTEVDDTRTVVVLMTKVGYISRPLMERLEDKALEFAEHFSAEDTRRVALALAAQNRRSVPLLRALSYHLVQRQFGLSSSLLIDLAFAYGKLNFHQTQVFQKMASDLLPKVPELNPNDISRCVKSFAYLKWLNLPLFEAFTQYTIDNAEKFTILQLCNIVLAFARLNFQPSRGEGFYELMHQRVGAELDSLNPQLLIDLVWSLCVLQQVNPSYLQKVLHSDFCSSIFGDRSSKMQSCRLKLIHINSTARLEGAEYKGPLLPTEILTAELSQLGDRKPSQLQTELREVIKGLAGDVDCCRTAVDTVYGWQMDGEMVLNSENKPLPLNEMLAPHVLQFQGTQPLPEGAHRLAFLSWAFPNYSTRSKDLLGRFALARRHFQAAGFLIVDVPYYEWLDLKSEWQKAAFLKDKMGKAVAEEMAK